MKTLVIVRHGKSSWDHIDLKDYHRPLKQRGVDNAFSIAEELLRLEITPDLVVSSPAVRAIDTAIIVCTRSGYPLEKIKTDQRIYEASVSELVKVLSEQEDEHGTVFIFGHNPGFTSLVNRLQNEPLVNLPTAGVFAIDLPIHSWSEIAQAKGKKKFSIIPKELG